MQGFPRVSLQKSFFGRKMEAFGASFLVNPLLESSESLRVETPSLRLSESCSIDTRNRTSSTGGGPPTVSTLLTQRREPDAVLSGHQVLGQQPSARNNQHQQTKTAPPHHIHHHNH